jgi:integrase/recombinase XerD
MGSESACYRNRFAERSAHVSITISQACTGFIHYQSAAGRSPYTLRNYRVTFAKLAAYMGDPPLAGITRSQIVDFLAYLREDYISEPAGVAPRPARHLAPKSILNIHADLSALWRWAVEEEFVPANIVRTIEPPAPTVTTVDPFTQAEVEKLFAVCDSKKTWNAPVHEMGAIADRDRCILFLLVDTGLRASELCSLRIEDFDMGRNRITVRHGKGDKDRFVQFGKRSAKAIWRYLTPRLPTEPTDPFITVGPADDQRPMDRRILRVQLARIGERAGVPHVYPHRFRHTFAITYLRNGGDLFTLQELLGHSDLDMVRRYARIAQTDCAKAHAKASPADNWRLG